MVTALGTALIGTALARAELERGVAPGGSPTCCFAISSLPGHSASAIERGSGTPGPGGRPSGSWPRLQRALRTLAADGALNVNRQRRPGDRHGVVAHGRYHNGRRREDSGGQAVRRSGDRSRAHAPGRAAASRSARSRSTHCDARLTVASNSARLGSSHPPAVAQHRAAHRLALPRRLTHGGAAGGGCAHGGDVPAARGHRYSRSAFRLGAAPAPQLDFAQGDPVATVRLRSAAAGLPRSPQTPRRFWGVRAISI
jgi:hypothetical protein